MKHPGRESERSRRRVDQALPVLRRTLAEYLTALPKTPPGAFRDDDLQRLLKTFIVQFNELPLRGRRTVLTLAHAARDARNEWAHDAGALRPERALYHLSTVRQLLEALGAREAFEEVDGLYREQMRVLAAPAEAASSERTGEPDAPPPVKAAPMAAEPAPQGMDMPGGRPGGKYVPLYERLTTASGDRWRVSFGELEGLLRFRLPDSARRHQAWWSNSTSHSHAKAWLRAGWATREVDVGAERLSFVRTSEP